MNHSNYLAAAFSSVILISGYADAQNKSNATPAVVLTDAGEALENKYTSAQAALQSELEKALPKLDEAKVAAWLQAIQAEEDPEQEAVAKAKEVEKWQGAEGRLRDLEEQLKYAPQTLEDAQEDLARARARGEEDPERMKVLQNAESLV